MPRKTKPNISLKHKRNVTAQHMAAATAALAVSNGLTSEIATNMGMMAAECVAKSYSNNSNSKSYSETIKNGNGNSGNAGWSVPKTRTRNAASGNLPHQTSPMNAGHRNRSSKNTGITRPASQALVLLLEMGRPLLMLNQSFQRTMS